MAVYKGKVRLVIKNYPYKYRDYSHIAAEASLAARDQGKFWEMHDLLLKKSPQLDRASLIGYAKELGLDVKRFTESLDAMKHSTSIEKDKKLAVDMDLYNTPTFFINGRKVIGNRPYEYFQKIMEEELRSAKK
ncbi:MAG: thioredoxin domain-containing protein [Nitrospirae bacterium]|nr:thioredoxin domain-containing protein [Nitrospirota bacterium]MCL5421529.1 thioredoxin domain-containing protein [Nitrospirota bacterium]